MTFAKIFPDAVTLTSSKTDIIAGQTQRIDFEFDPVDTYDRQLVWASSDLEIASVSSHGEYGLLTAKKMGTVTISAYSVMDETISSSLTINVLKASTLNDQQEADLASFVRKGLGHYSLFLANGLLAYLTFFYFLKGKKRHYRYFLAALGVGLPLAVGMEALQLFANGRSPLVTDAVINFLGYLTGTLILLIVFVSWRAKQNRLKPTDAPR
jgi:VanZ family protein